MIKGQTNESSDLKIVYVPIIPIIDKNHVIDLDENKAGKIKITERLKEVGEIVLKARTYEIEYDENNIIVERIDKETGKILTSKKKKRKKKKKENLNEIER